MFMIDFKKYFNDEYQFTLKNAAYSWIENSNQGAEMELTVSDTIDATVQEASLEVIFQREVYFKPEALFSIGVSFVVTLTFRDKSLADEAKSVNWSKELAENENPYLGNVVSRASHLIAMLTSSYGQQPLVTPPSVVR